MSRPILALAILTLAGSAHAQTALGDGRGLENTQINVTPRGSQNDPRSAFLDQIRLRNAVVTGNAPGGLSFRGDVGYTAPGEFRGELGANDLFAFRRDSLTSGLTGYGIRGTEAIQYQFALTTGTNAPPGLLGSPIVRPFGSADGITQGPGSRSIPALGEASLGPRDPLDVELDQLRLPGGTLMGTLRSPSAYMAGRASAPALLVAAETETGKRVGMIASTLDGVRFQELDPPAWLIREDGTPRLTPTDTRIEPTRTAYDEVLQRLSALRIDAQNVDAPSQRPMWEIRLDEIRAKLDELAPKEPATPGLPGATFGQDAIDLIRGAAGDVGSLIVGGDPDYDPYIDHVRQAETLLREGRYFDAEERFTRALSLRTGDVPAQVGRIHAQLGAGMYLSSSINLRSLLTRHPEVTGVRYAPTLLPTPERTRGLIATLKENIKGDSGTLARESALLLAYLGHQIGDRALIQAGLEAFERNASTSDQRLISLLRGVWEGPASAPAQPTGSDDMDNAANNPGG